MLALAACARGPRDAALPALRVGTTGDYPPFARTHEGEVEGLDAEVARRFARDTGRRVEWVTTRWPDLTRDLAAGRFDLAMGGVTMRPERALVGTYTRPVAQTGAVVLTRAGVARVPADLDRMGTRIAVNRGGHLERVARRLFPHADVDAVDDNQTLPRLLGTGAVEAILTDDAEAGRFAADVPAVVRLGPLTHDRKAYLGADKGLVAELDAWLRAREVDGTLATLRGRWLGERYGAARSGLESDVDALLATVELRLALMPAVAAAKEAARLPVEDTAQEARVLAAAREQAAARGLDPAAAEALFTAIIGAARGVQREFLATPPARRPAVERLDLARELRPTIARLSEAIVARAAAVARDPGLATLDPERLAEELDVAVLPRAARVELARAVTRLAPVPHAPVP